MRSYNIYSENKEEYIKEYEKTKSRLSQMIFNKNEIKESLQEDEEDDLGFQKKQSFHFNNLDEEDDSDLGALNNDDDEDLIGHEYDNQENITKDNTGDKGIEILVSYLKTSIMGEIKNMDLDRNTIIFNRNKNIMSMSGNAIYDLNIRELVENILAEDGNEYIKSSEGNNNSLRDFIFQNIQSDSTLKIMVLSNNKNTKKSFMNKFFDVKDEPEEDKIYEEVDTDEPFEIRKKQIKLFNKNIGLQMFDTSDEFHESSNLITSVYYKAVSAFFIFIESTNRNVKKYLDNIYEKISKYFINRTVVIFGVNMLFKEDCTIDGENLRDYANEKEIIIITININNFELKYSIINNLFNLILIKGIDHKANLNSNRKGSRDKKLGGFKNNLTNKINNESNQKKNIYDITKMNVPSSLGYKKKYRIKHINAFDLDDKNERNSKRKLSMDI